jgi:hypothetical protein
MDVAERIASRMVGYHLIEVERSDHRRDLHDVARGLGHR